MLQVIANFDIVSSETGKILDYNASNLTLFNKLYHLSKALSVKVGSGATVVNEF